LIANSHAVKGPLRLRPPAQYNSSMSNTSYKNQLIPPPELDTPPRKGLSFDQLLFVWSDLMDTCDHLLRANLQRMAGPEGDAASLYRDWYEMEMKDHDQMIRHLLGEISKRDREDDR
jgi:hypothetical protein